MNYNKFVLPNGLRIMTVPNADSPSATAVVFVGVGSRYEPENLAGISHFVEHNVFKGTTNRPSRDQIAGELEGLGGVTNAGTSHDFTYYYAKAASAQLPKILDLVMDVSLNMSFPEKDLEIERGNVLEEINMYQDEPRGRLSQNFTEFLWGDQPVGRSILGTKETLMSITKDGMHDFVAKNYTPDRMVVMASGGVETEAVRKQVEGYYRNVGQSQTDRSSVDEHPFHEFQVAPRVYLDSDKTNQTHFLVGFKTFGRGDPRCYALDLVNTVLGEGMSSRLFRKIRDELGLAYYIGSGNGEFSDTGYWLTFAGVDSTRAEAAIMAVLDEYKRLAEEPISEAELRKGKEYLKGRTLLSVETSDEIGEWWGFRELLNDEMISPQEYNERIEALTGEDLRKLVAGLLRNDRLNLGIVGPFEERERFEKLLHI